MTMEAKDLMIGDWVRRKSKIKSRVTELRSAPRVYPVNTEHGEVNPRTELEPIPITGEVLEKNGFEKTSDSPVCSEYRLCVVDYCEDYLFVKLRKRVDIVQVYYYPDMSSTKIEYTKKEMSVHEIQHAMRMCGIEKEIAL